MPLQRPVGVGENQRPILGSDESILDQASNVEVFFDPQETQGKGTLYVTTRNVIWISQPETSFMVDVPSIMVHAISRDRQAFAMSCLYCQLDVPDDDLSEIRFVPEDETLLEEIYHAFSSSAALNPDLPGPDDDAAGDFFFNGDEVNSGLNSGLNPDLLTALTGMSVENVQANGSAVEAEDEEIGPTPNGANGHGGQFDDAEEDC